MNPILIIGARERKYDYYRQINELSKENNASWWNPLSLASDKGCA